MFMFLESWFHNYIKATIMMTKMPRTNCDKTIKRGFEIDYKLPDLALPSTAYLWLLQYISLVQQHS